jgi:hypothetical protein
MALLFGIRQQARDRAENIADGVALFDSCGHLFDPLRTQTPLCRRRFHGATWNTWKATAAAAQLAAALFRRDCRRSPVTNLSKSGLGPPPPVRAKVQTCGGIGTTEDQSHSAADRQPNTIDAQAIIALSVFRAARLATLPLATYQALNGGRGLNLRYGVSFDSGSLLVGGRRRHSPGAPLIIFGTLGRVGFFAGALRNCDICHS